MKYRQFDSLDEKENSAVHAIGNGEIMLYGKGPQWLQVLGAPYSCPTVFSMTVPEGDSVKCVSHRRERAGSWEHVFPDGTMTDCASSAHHCLARHWELKESVRFSVRSDYSVQSVGKLFPKASGAWLISLQSTAPIYNDYPLGHNTCMLICALGGCRAEQTDGGIMLTFSDSGTMYITGAEEYPDCVEQMKHASCVPFEEVLSRADMDDAAFLESCAKNRAPLREHPQKARVLEAVEDVLMLIKAQQHGTGGVQAGHNYHLAYVRDQYGVSRGLLSMGAFDRAKDILKFYRSVFERWGFIKNAQAMGVDGIFHCHENDLVEITGYLLLEVTDCLEVDGDKEFFVSLMPMCEWATYSQLSSLHNDMLPFNGDETYVAGGVLPRTTLNHGSFEATLLFITGALRYLDVCERLGLSQEWMKEARKTAQRVSAKFDDNFRRGEKYITNSLKRVEGLKEPEYRHGVCYFGDCFGWLTRKEQGCYVCPNCIGKDGFVPCCEEFSLKSTLLMAPFVKSEQLSCEHLAAQTAEYLEEYRKSGRLPSRPDGERSMGYDYGLLVFAAARSGLDADDLLEKMLSLQDDCGAWCEYYNSGKPRGTLCRPWESAINIAGALEYLK